MPLRSLIYFTIILQEMLKKRDIYGRKLVKIPIPKFVVFYNGDEEQPEQYDQRLSDAFAKPVDNPQLELVCRVYNINHGKNKDLLDKCPVIKEYMIFVDYVRAYHRENDFDDLRDAIERAIDRCIEEHVLKDFLIKHRSEVVKVMQLDYTIDRRIELQRADAREEGLEEGRAEGRAQGRAQGREEGRAQGRAEGREQGRAEGRAEGRAQGRAEGIERERMEGINSLISSLKFFKIPTEELAGQLVKQYSLNPDKAMEYAQKQD
jgi:hypothetical protein